MGNKAEQLRAMREASADSKAPTKHKIVEGLQEALSIARGETEPAKLHKIKKLRRAPPSPLKRPKLKSKNGGVRFVPNKTKGRPHGGKAHLTNEARKPWEAMEISRRTWYRRMAKGAV